MPLTLISCLSPSPHASHPHLMPLTLTSCLSPSHHTSHLMPLTLTSCLSPSPHASHPHLMPLTLTSCLSPSHHASHPHIDYDRLVTWHVGQYTTRITEYGSTSYVKIIMNTIIKPHNPYLIDMDQLLVNNTYNTMKLLTLRKLRQ